MSMNAIAIASIIMLAPGQDEGRVSTTTVTSESCWVESYYGVSINLRVEDLNVLPYNIKLGIESSEGEDLRTATIVAENNILIIAVFAKDGKALLLKTASKSAIGPRGIRVGSSLSEVQKKWPEGKFYYGSGEGARYARFLTGSNVAFYLDTSSIGKEPSAIFVQEIRIFPFKTL